MNNIIYMHGVPTPKYKAQQIRQDLDPDLFVDMLAGHPEHIRRAKEKYRACMAEAAKRAAREQETEESRERLLSVLGHLAVFSLLALVVTVAMVL